MGWGLFGKLPQKRDFLALGLPRAVLEPFENWLQSAVAASRNQLGGGWQDRYLVAPIWRFWIGKDVFGTQCAGALMPSVDGVGRFFPLSILWAADEGASIPCPLFEPRGDWYAAIEQRLLTVLDQEAAIVPERLIEGLPAPEAAGAGPDPAARPLRRGFGWQEEGPVDELMPRLIAADLFAITPMRSYWWTQGGEGGKPMVYSHNALPDAVFFTTMINGELA
ncbi:MAG: type VI secretion system-associated protein TagF [Rhizobiaceae bacterium]|nr:type VI secretion system-associated protein TagF [Rhizobiaceae bacterium]MCV0405798.1 type VI secretion system-associated protein TagF [Rhizobiaceae bacterium]